MKRCSYILLLLALLVSSCSTQKNTRASRAYHAMKVNYNIYYNGNTAFEEGLQDIARANKDDYTTLLNLYPVSNHKAAEAATASRSAPRPTPNERETPPTVSGSSRRSSILPCPKPGCC